MILYKLCAFAGVCGWLQFSALSHFPIVIFFLPVPLAARSKAWACGRSHAGIVDSNPRGGMDV